MNHEVSMQDFEIQKKLGQGAFGQVYLIRRKQDNNTYALKKVKLIGTKDKEKHNALNQIRILASLNDEYIVKFKEAFYDGISNCLCIVMQYASGGDLMKAITTHLKNHSRFKEDQVWKALVNMLKGLKSLHDKKILHRDIKSANIFISQDGKYKLGDLNVSKVLKKGLAYTQTGTPYYASPQVWQDLPYDMKSDIWSLGCVVYEMVALQPPFKASDLQGLFKRVKAGQYRPISTQYSSDLSQIIGLMLKVKPKDRLGTDDLLRHPIIKKKCGIQVSQAEIYNYYNQEDALLKTIKFNPHNLKSINMNLPKSSYGKQESKQKLHQRRNSYDSLDNLKRDRALSACRISQPDTNQSGKNGYNKYIPVQPLPQGQGMKPVGMHLPPKPIKKNEEINKDPGARFRRVGEDLLRKGQRSSSVNQ